MAKTAVVNLDDGRVVQRQVLYLGEIGSSQATAWRKAIEVFDEAAGEPRTLALVPEDRCAAIDDASAVRVCLSALTLRRPRQWGACWLAGQLWRELQLDQFWAEWLPPSRKGTRWDQILQVWAACRARRHPVRNRLAAGGSRIRTIGPACRRRPSVGLEFVNRGDPSASASVRPIRASLQEKLRI